MIKDVTNSIKATLYQRVSSPLYGTYIFSWVLYNWEKTLKLAFSSKDFDERLLMFKESFGTVETGVDYWSFLFPIVLTVFILFFQPVIQKIIFVYNEKNKHEGLNARDKFDNERRLTIEESMVIKGELTKLHESNSISLKIKEDEKQDLNRKHEAQVEINKDLEVLKNKLFDDLNDAGTKLDNLKGENYGLRDNNDKLKKIHEEEKQRIIDNLKESYNRDVSSLNKSTDLLTLELTKINEKYKSEVERTKNIIESESWFVNKSFSEDLPKIFDLGEQYSVEYKVELFSNLLKISNENSWVRLCYEFMVRGFDKVTSTKNSDRYFDYIITLHYNNFNYDELDLLYLIMEKNILISGSQNYEKSLKMIIKEKASRRVRA